MQKEIDLQVLEEVFGSRAKAIFAVQMLEAAMNLRAGLSREQTSNAMLSHQANGRRMSARLPFGQMVDPNDSAQMIPNAYEQEVIQKVVVLKSEGLSLRKIAKRLTDLEYQPRKVNRLFKGRTVQVKGKWYHGLTSLILKRVETEKKNEMESCYESSDGR